MWSNHNKMSHMPRSVTTTLKNLTQAKRESWWQIHTIFVRQQWDFNRFIVVSLRELLHFSRTFVFYFVLLVNLFEPVVLFSRWFIVLCLAHCLCLMKFAFLYEKRILKKNLESLGKWWIVIKHSVFLMMSLQKPCTLVARRQIKTPTTLVVIDTNYWCPVTGWLKNIGDLEKRFWKNDKEY